ncbi:MAG: DNA-directed RNA polymerase subunit omega [Planctomycetota bacterium]|nr:DNA-directed RNA polymerase subunit omega [Planctomycetota bacterium]
MEARDLEALLDKVGGKFKLVTLFQKRMRELQRGLPRLVVTDTANMWEVVSREIMETKADLVMGEEAEQMRKELAARESEELAEGDKGKLPKPAEAGR